MMRSALVLAALLACGQQDAAPKRDEPAKPEAKPQVPQKLARLQMAVPDGWTSTYDTESDKWLFETPKLPDGRTANARIERAPDSAVASPDAYVVWLKRSIWDLGTSSTFEKRESVKDGFAMTLVVKANADPEHPKRETYVIRQLGNVWYQCLSEWIPDDAIRDQVVSLCKSLAFK